jgi:signal transduction histidine kinase
MGRTPLLSIGLNYEHDLVAARRRARQIGATLGLNVQDQTQIATVTSEMARNALRYATGGRVEFAIEDDASSSHLVITVSDRGPGIANIDEVLSGSFVSRTGMGIGIVGARRLMDDFDIATSTAGTRVVMKKKLRRTATKRDAAAIADELARAKPDNPMEEIQQQNGELLRALADLNERQEELRRLNRELEDTNRGVLALYAELDEKAESLRRADTLKSRFLSDMSHEFRTPVNSILALTRLLEERNIDGEGVKQVSLIRHAAQDLESLVNDLLDLAKIEAGKVEVRPAEFDVENLFSALRGMLRPLLVTRSLALVFEDVHDLPPMFTDEAKVSQILRNFISNAIKFTEAGEVRVSALLSDDGDFVTFSVADTGIGIAPEDLDRIFQEFTQVESELQRKHKGTGLGLPLTRRLTELLGGTVAVNSVPGVGSTFSARIPVHYAAGVRRFDAPAPTARVPETAERKSRILIIDDDATARYTLASFAAGPGIEFREAENGLQGISLAQGERPDMVFLDLMMPGIGGHEVLERLKGDTATSGIPVVVVTSRFINEDERKQILSRAQAVINKGDLSRDVVGRAIRNAIGR